MKLNCGVVHRIGYCFTLKSPKKAKNTIADMLFLLRNMYTLFVLHIIICRSVQTLDGESVILIPDGFIYTSH